MIKKNNHKRHGQFIKDLYRAIGYKIADFLDSYTSVKANHVTYFRACLGFLTCYFYIDGSYVYLLISIPTILFFGILDTTDGCLASIQKKSYLGGWVDSVTDVFMMLLYFVSISMHFILNNISIDLIILSNNIFIPNKILILIPAISYGLLLAYSRLNEIYSSPKLFGALEDKDQLRIKETSEYSFIDKIKLNIAPFFFNIHIIFVIGALINNMAIISIFLLFYIAAYNIRKIISIGYFGYKTDKKNLDI